MEVGQLGERTQTTFTQYDSLISNNNNNRNNNKVNYY